MRHRTAASPAALAALMVLTAAGVHAPTPAASQAALDPAEVAPRDTAVLRALDKQMARVREFTVPVGGTETFYGLTVTVRECVTSAVSTTPQDGAFLEIRDRSSYGDVLKKKADAQDRPDAKEPGIAYSGWMFSRTPSISALEHPIYDIWLKECTDAPPQVAEVPVPDRKPGALVTAAPRPRNKPQQPQVAEVPDD